MEEFNLDLTLDEAAEARIAHAEFLDRVKNWGGRMGMIIQPYSQIASVLLDEDRSKEDLEQISIVFPLGLKLTIEHLNELYNLLQYEAIKVLGAPFQWHAEHNDQCDGTKNNCGHQDHYKAGDES